MLPAEPRALPTSVLNWDPVLQAAQRQKRLSKALSFITRLISVGSERLVLLLNLSRR